MEGTILDYAEFGILGIFSLLLLTKGLNSVIELTKTTAILSESQKALADSVTKLAEKVADVGTRLSSLGYQIEGVERRLDKLEENSARNFNELRDLIRGRSDSDDLQRH